MKLFERWLRDRGCERWAMATVLSVRGSTPRHAGARMFCAASGAQLGTIGGGRIEQVTSERARVLATTGGIEIVEPHLVRDLAMCCGGSMRVAISSIGESQLAAVEQAVHAWQRRDIGQLALLLDSGDLKFCAGGDGRTRLEEDRFLLGVSPSPRLIVLGWGHVGRALARIATTVGFEVVVCDDGDTGALESRPVDAVQVIESFAVRDLDDALAGGLGTEDYVVIVTREHAIDQRALEELLPRQDLAYLGLIGSRGKIARFQKRLQARGAAGVEAWARVHAPIGLEIGAESPEEIAVSIVAELIAVRKQARRCGGQDG